MNATDYRRRRRLLGLCRNCDRVPEPGYTACASCRANFAYQRVRREDRMGDDERKLRDRAHRYRIPVDEARRLLAIKTCAICGGDRRLIIEHNHTTGKVRGRVCAPCNQMLGNAKDRPDLLRRAAEYLEGSNP